MTVRREFITCLAGASAGSGLVLLASVQNWFTTGQADAAEMTGQQVAPLAGAAGLAGLASVAAIVATRGVPRRVVALLMVVCGAAILVGSIAPEVPAELTAANAAMTAWPWLASGGAVLLLGAGSFSAIRGGRWPVMSARYDRRRAGGASGKRTDLWDAIDRGLDPTLDATDEKER